MVSTAAFATKKIQLGTAALAVATAATFTPMAAHAAPNFAPLAGIGASANSAVTDPVIKPIASATTSPCTTASFKLGCYAVEGVTQGTTAIVRGVGIYIGTVAYVLVDGTGQLLKAIGGIFPGAVGTFFTNLGNGVSTVANDIAFNFKVGPYLAP